MGCCEAGHTDQGPSVTMAPLTVALTVALAKAPLSMLRRGDAPWLRLGAGVLLDHLVGLG